MRYESFSAPEIMDILEFVGDKDIVSLMIGQSPEGNHAPFFTVVVERTVEDKPHKGRPKGWKKGDPYV